MRSLAYILAAAIVEMAAGAAATAILMRHLDAVLAGVLRGIGG